MKAKKLNILFASLFALIFLIGFTSALTLSSSTSELSQDGGTFTLTLGSATGPGALVYAVKDSDGTSYTGFTFNQSAFAGNDVLLVKYTVPSDFNFEFTEEYTVTVTATETADVSKTAAKDMAFVSSTFCESVKNKGNLNLNIEDITVTDGFGDDNEWFAFDTVEVEITVENNGNEDVQDVTIEWGLYNTQSKEWTIEIDNEDEINVDEGDEETVTFSFALNDDLDENLEDLEDGDYILYVRATGEISDGTYEGNDTCSSESDTASLTVEKNFVVLSNIEVPTLTQCGSEVTISGDVWNVGSKDQNDVTVEIYNKELGLDEIVEMGDIDSFESSDLEFTFQLGDNLEEKEYPITFTVYDEDNDAYENNNDDKSTSAIKLAVQGSCSADIPDATVNAYLESGGKAGEQLVVKATITNTGEESAYYSINLAGYADWASAVSIDKNLVTLDAGDSEDVLITFDVKKDAEGTSLFNIEVLSDNELVVSQPVQLDITAKKGFSLTGNLFSSLGDNKYIWGIGILNLILIVLIIVIAVRIARK